MTSPVCPGSGSSPAWSRLLAGLLSFAGLVPALALPEQPPSAPRLAEAMERLDRERVRELLAAGAEVDAAQPDGMTALLWAAHLDELELARALVGAGADVRRSSHHGVTALSLACANGNGDLVELLLSSGADPRTTLPGGETALMTAARTGRSGPVKALLARGADPNAHEDHGQTALHWAAAEGHLEVVQLLLAAGAERDAKLLSGLTPLFFAVREGKSKVVHELLRAGSDVNAALAPERSFYKAARRGTSPLLLAVENGHFELAVELLRAGADPNDQRSGYTALHALTWTRKTGRGDDEAGDPPPEGSGSVTSLECAARLVGAGADVNLRLSSGPSPHGGLSRKGATPFLLAALTADVAYMKQLLALGADPRLPNDDGATPLLAAAGLGILAPTEEAGTEAEAVEAVQLLLGLGADPNALDRNGETALHGAAYRNAPLVVALLGERGARPEVWNRPNKYGWTPLAIARGHRSGNFKPSPETAAAIEKLLGANVEPPRETTRKF